MRTSFTGRSRVGLWVFLGAIMAPACSPAGIHDDPHTIALLKEIGAVTDEELKLVATHGDGHIKGLDLMGKDISRVLPHLDGR